MCISSEALPVYTCRLPPSRSPRERHRCFSTPAPAALFSASHCWEQGWTVLGLINSFRSSPGAPNLWDLMPGDVKWSSRNDNRNKVHNKLMHLNHPQTTPPPGSMENCLPQNQTLVPTRLETAALNLLLKFSSLPLFPHPLFTKPQICLTHN